MSEAASEVKDSVGVLLVPWAADNLLLANASVVEVLRQSGIEIEPVTGEGMVKARFRWRNRSIPMIDLAALLNVEAQPTAGKKRILVCHGYSSKPNQQFIGIEANGIPRMVLLDEDGFRVISDEESGSLPLISKVDLQGRIAYIPDLEKIAQMLV